MSEITILYKGYETIIQYQRNENFEEIFKRFKIQVNAENKKMIYLYKGEIIKDEELTISQLIDETKVPILAYEQNDLPNNILIKSDYVICPKCKESAILEQKDYKLIIYGCQNGHITKNILINEFNKLQEIDYSKIICQKCNKNNRSNTYNNKFFWCGKCKMCLCPICISIHDNNHKIINYDDKEYICDIHNEVYNTFCYKCKKNICIECEKNHSDHKLLAYNNLIIEDDEIIKNMEEIRREIDIFNNSIKEKIKQLNKIIENIEEYYKIIKNIIKKYLNDKKQNFHNLININKIINNNVIIRNIKEINNNNNLMI